MAREEGGGGAAEEAERRQLDCRWGFSDVYVVCLTVSQLNTSTLPNAVASL